MANHSKAKLKQIERPYMLGKAWSRIVAILGGLLYSATAPFSLNAKQLGPLVVLRRGGKR